MSKLDGFCPICKQFIEVHAKGYLDHPFIDGNYYQDICFVCDSVPKMWEYSETMGLKYFVDFDIKRLHSLEEMIEDGFDKKEAFISIQAVKKAIRKAKTT